MTVFLQSGAYWWRFQQPYQVICVDRAADIIPALHLIEKTVNSRQLYAVGFLQYEAAAAFGLAVKQQRSKDRLPLLWFGLYPPPQRHHQLPPAHAAYRLGAWHTQLSSEAYLKQVHRIQEYLAAGDIYQINYTFHHSASFQGDPWSCCHHLFKQQRGQFMAYLDLGRWVIISSSPEQFLQCAGDDVTARPMKGTCKRGRWLSEDQQFADQLQQSPKERAENVMIVDMMRNDLGRVARIGSVRVPQLFHTERYPTLWQMTSTITARVTTSITQLLTACFPSASITGAPKVRAMQLIAELEQEPRGVYTGAIGVIAPNRCVRFNVAIRTLVIDQYQHQAQYGVGSGIVWGASASAEYQECLLKARILTPHTPKFQLLETVLWTPEEGYYLYQRHLARLSATATYFQFKCSIPQLTTQLRTLASTLTQPTKIRILISPDGAISIQTEVLHQAPRPLTPLRVRLAPQPVSPENPWLYHKTTHRSLYDQARAAHPDCDDVLLWNHHEQVTEATTANIVVPSAGVWLTPPIDDGLLPGTLRAELLARQQLVECTIPLKQLYDAPQFYLINSVRQWRVARLVS
jgi:para-aminobenzoate synthetase/4-amino-4-deoxychorismate lyase